MGREKAVEILTKYYSGFDGTLQILIAHGDAIYEKIRSIITRKPWLNVDETLLEEAAYLHDIGIVETHTPGLGCFGKRTYLEHGVVGRRILETEGLVKHARIAERHIGVGLTVRDVVDGGLPLPKRDMVPETTEEELLCFADLFFSKHRKSLGREKSSEKIRAGLGRFGARHVIVFDRWCEKFGEQC